MDKTLLPTVVIRTHRGSGERVITLTHLKKVAHLCQARAAACLGVGNTRFKTACRELGMSSWPYRKIKSIRGLIKAVHVTRGTWPDQETGALLHLLSASEDLIFENPLLPLSGEFKKLRQMAYKKNHVRRAHQQALKELDGDEAGDFEFDFDDEDNDDDDDEEEEGDAAPLVKSGTTSTETEEKQGGGAAEDEEMMMTEQDERNKKAMQCIYKLMKESPVACKAVQVAGEDEEEEEEYDEEVDYYFGDAENPL